MRKKTKKNGNSVKKTVQGVISISSKGTGYVNALGWKDDIEIDSKDLNTALHGDTVLVILNAKKHNRITGEVSDIITRSKIGFSGILEKDTLEKNTNVYFLKPDDTKMYRDILIPEKMLNGAKVGQKVYAEITFWKYSNKSPEGKVIKILGNPGDNDTEMFAIAIEKGFDNDFPEKVEKEAKEIKSLGIRSEDYKNRRDFRNTTTFTIDPEDAKDFDDAISFKEIGKDKYEIGIHIADVSHYVKIGSELDKEAKKRGTSVYLVDRTIPMLPEALSNDLCSLVPNKDRLTMSAVFILNKNAQVEDQWFGRTVIHSNKRFTYEEAEKATKDPKAPFYNEISILNNLAKKLTKERFDHGAISLDQEEVKFILNEDGIPIKVIKKVRGDSNKLIEEFMLLANKKVAETISKGIKGKGKNENIFVYRVHDNPSKEKMEDLAFFLRGIGLKISLKDGIIPNYELNKLLKGLEGKSEEDTVNRAVIRSMAKAIYSTQNIGHYGLAFKYYAHFTSPIRRYPDIVVHRLLADFLKGQKVGMDKLSIYEEISRKSSEREKFAADAERASVKYKQVEYMTSRIKEEFEGIVSGITEWGIYIEEVETKCEGLVRLRDMEDDYYVYNEKKMELVGQKKKKVFRLGDKVKIKVKDADLEKKTIDYVLI